MHVDGLKEWQNLAFSKKEKELMNKKMIIEKFEQKDYGQGVKEIITTDKEGKKHIPLY